MELTAKNVSVERWGATTVVVVELGAGAQSLERIRMHELPDGSWRPNDEDIEMLRHNSDFANLRVPISAVVSLLADEAGSGRGFEKLPSREP